MTLIPLKKKNGGRRVNVSHGKLKRLEMNPPRLRVQKKEVMEQVTTPAREEAGEVNATDKLEAMLEQATVQKSQAIPLPQMSLWRGHDNSPISSWGPLSAGQVPLSLGRMHTPSGSSPKKRGAGGITMGGRGRDDRGGQTSHT